jgi:hypothetical protein
VTKGWEMSTDKHRYGLTNRWMMSKGRGGSPTSVGQSLERILARALREEGYRVLRPDYLGPDLVVSRAKRKKQEQIGVFLKVATRPRLSSPHAVP